MAERRLILRDPPYLTLRWASPDWRVYAVRDPEPLVDPIGAAAARVRLDRPAGLRPGRLEPGPVPGPGQLHPYWSIARGEGCLMRHGDWTLVRADRPGVFRVAADFSLGPRLERGHRRPQDLLSPPSDASCTP